MNNKATLIIPAHNEEDIILRALSSVESQELEDIPLSVIVIPNGCVDQTEKVAQKFDKKNPNITWEIHSLQEGHRAKALNYGISQADTDIVMYLNPDCIINSDAVVKMYKELVSSQELHVVGMFDEPDCLYCPPNTSLLKVQKLISYNKRLSNKIIVGRFIAFKKASFPPFPEMLHSEDTWLHLYACDKYGSGSTKILYEPSLLYLPYQNWVDFMRTESRYLEGTNQIFDYFPELEAVYHKIRELSEEEQLKVMELLKRFCETNDIELDFAMKFKEIVMPLVVENSRIMHQISKKGEWEETKHNLVAH
ncbi:MAG: glycosyltransferase family 2 protein [Parcubacteria group bacterium]